MIKFTCIIILTLYMNLGMAQSFEQYLKGYCLEMAAYCVHPFFKFDKAKSSVKIFHKGAVLDLHYSEGVNTVLSLHFEDGIITKTELNYDSHFIPAFSTIYLLKSLFIFKPNDEIDVLGRKIIRFYKELYQKPVADFDATQITTATLSYYWADYVTKTDRRDISDFLGTKGTPEALEIVDGLTISGPRIFTTRVIESLGIIKTYDPEFYNTYLANNTNMYRVVRGIRMNTKHHSNTIDEGNFLALLNKHALNPDKSHNPFYLASVIVHETVHLYQYSMYYRLFECNLSAYLYSDNHDPVAFAKKEIYAHSVQLSFMKKLPQNSSKLESAIEAANQYIKDYTEAREAGYLMFSSGGECGLTCKQQACAKMNPLYVKYGIRAGMERLYKLICLSN